MEIGGAGHRGGLGLHGQERYMVGRGAQRRRQQMMMAGMMPTRARWWPRPQGGGRGWLVPDYSRHQVNPPAQKGVRGGEETDIAASVEFTLMTSRQWSRETAAMAGGQ